ncbi:hypothetical protein [Aeribacillus pallidus]|uniref:hypothetical protein n=1 Tax=Aeribacillus pallidus TaxID=33936 RepID=UPI003D22C998
MITLQKIVALKFLGFSLEEINPSPFSKEEEEWVAKAVEIFLENEGGELNG